MAKKKSLTIRALRTKQGNGIEVFAFFAPGDVLIELAEISRVHRDDDAKLAGFQRKEIKNHVKAIVEYLDAEDVLFPNAIILALSGEVEFKQVRGSQPTGLTNTSQAGTLSIPIRTEGAKAAWVVDGQQRSIALSKTKNKGLPVPVIAFSAPNLEMQREQFILVNKARPLPSRLINELLPEVDTHLPKDLSARKTPSTLVDLLHRDPESPFFELIKRVSEPSSRKAIIVDTALVQVIRKSINDPLGALSQYKGIGTNDSDIEGMYNTLLLFWSEVRSVFVDAWGKPPTKSRLMHSAGINAMGILMDRVMTRASTRTNSKKHIRQSLKAIAPDCCWTTGVWPDLGLKWNEVQNVPRHVKLLAEQLAKLDYEANLHSH